MASLKILFAGIRWPPETFIEQLIKGVADAGADVTLACEKKPEASWLPHPRVGWIYAPRWQGNAPARLLRTGQLLCQGALRGFSDVRLLSARLRSQDNWGKWCQMWHRVSSFAGRRWDVIYFPWNSAAISYLPLFDLGMPVVLSCRGAQISVAPHNPERSTMCEGLKETFARAALVHCVSEDIKKEAVKLGLDPQKARVIQTPVDVKFFEQLGHPKAASDVFKIINVGGLIWRKGQEYGLQAVKHLVDEGYNVQIDIIGDGPDLSRLLYTIEDLGLEEIVRLHGSLPRSEVRAKLQQADAFLLCSLSEGLSNAVVEAMACGLPVVTTDCGGMREGVTDGCDGFVVPVRDARAMARALAKLIDDPILRRQMGAIARVRAMSCFSSEQQIAKFMGLCQEATQSRRDELHPV